MRPSIEPQPIDGDAAHNALNVAARSDAQSQGRGRGKLLLWLVLICIAVIGFASSAGWFDFAFKPTASEAEFGVAETALGTQRQALPGAVISPAAPGQSRPEAESVTAPPLFPIAPQKSLEIIDEGKRVAQHMAALMPNSLDAKEMLARYEYEFGNVQTAREIWTEMIELSPNHAYALVGLGDAATIDGDLQAAVRYFRRAVLSDPNNLSRQVTLGVALLHAAQLEEARQVLEAVLARDPENTQAHVELASALVQLHEFEAARNHFETALKSEPAHAAIHLGLTNVYRRLGNQDKAQFHQAEHRRFQELVVAGRERGRRTYDDDAAILIDVGKFYIDMARVYLAGGYRQSAEWLLLRASRMNSNDIDSRQALAALAAGQGKAFDAIRWLTEISELQPDELTFVREIARLYAEVQRPDDAEKLLINFVEQHPLQLDALRAAALFYVEVKPQADKAIEYATAAKELAPTAESFFMLASVFEASGKMEEAIKSLEKAVELDPKNTSYQQTLALLREKLVPKPLANGADRP